MNLLNKFYSDYFFTMWRNTMSTLKWLALQLKVHFFSVNVLPGNQTHDLLFKQQEWYEQVDDLTNMNLLNNLYSNYFFTMYLSWKQLALQ